MGKEGRVGGRIGQELADESGPVGASVVLHAAADELDERDGGALAEEDGDELEEKGELQREEEW